MKSNTEKRRYILRSLAWFGIELTPEDMLKLKEDEDISIPRYLDPYLIPLLPRCYKENTLNSLISLYFTGDLSSNAWEIVCSIMSEEEQILYATDQKYLGYPLRIASTFNNLNALKKLDSIFTELLDKFPHKKVIVHWQFRLALKDCFIHEKDTASFDFLLHMIEKHSVCVKKDKLPSLTNKALLYKVDGMMLKEGNTSLLEVYSDVAKEHIKERKFHSFSHLYTFLVKRGVTEKEYQQFQEDMFQVIAKEEEEKPYNNAFYKKIRGVLYRNRENLALLNPPNYELPTNLELKPSEKDTKLPFSILVIARFKKSRR